MKKYFLCRVLNFKIIILYILTTNCVKSVYGRHNHLNNNHHKHPRKTTNEEANFNIVCPIGDTGLHPYPNNCTRFVECAEGRLYIKDCADKTEFNKKNSICDHKYNLQCDWKYADDSSKHTADILCPKNANGLYSYPFDSCQYINCTNAKTWIQNCPKNTKFSITKRSCIGKDLIDKKDYVKYDLRYHNILAYKYLYKCPHHGEFKHLYPFDARKYVNCQNDKLKVMSCEATKVFSMIEHTCLAQDKVLITERVPFLKELSSERPQHEDELPISDKIYCTMDLFGLYPHPFDNTKYLKCVYGRLYSLSCRKGFVFSLSRKFCDIKEEFPTFDTLPAIQKDYKDESIIQIRTDDNLTYLECPLSLNGSFVYPFDCTKYTKCAQGKTEIFSCPKDHIYSIRKKQCHLGSEVNDNDHIECLIPEQDDSSNDDFSLGVFCSPTGSSKHPHPRDWHIYVQCHNGKLSVEKCPRNKVFSLKTRQCIKETFLI